MAAAVSRLRGSTVSKLLGQGVRMGWARPMGYAAQASMDDDTTMMWREPTSSRPLESMHAQEKDRGVQWVFLGCPGVGKGTYASRLAKLLEVPHIAMGDLVRHEILQKTSMADQVCPSHSSSMLRTMGRVNLNSSLCSASLISNFFISLFFRLWMQRIG